jgi:hypothetical protein
MPALATMPEWQASQLRANGHDGAPVSPSDAARLLDGQERILLEKIGEAGLAWSGNSGRPGPGGGQGLGHRYR